MKPNVTVSWKKLDAAKSKSDEASQKIDKLKDKFADDLNAQKIIKGREKARKRTVQKNNMKIKDITSDGKIEPVYVIDIQLAHYSEPKRKLIEKIFSIITAFLDSKTAEKLKAKIIEELK